MTKTGRFNFRWGSYIFAILARKENLFFFSFRHLYSSHVFSRHTEQIFHKIFQKIVPFLR